jgi:hypothetical protein
MEKRTNLTGWYEWDEMDEQMEREANALKRSFNMPRVGTPKRLARVAGGPKNRAERDGLIRVPE